MDLISTILRKHRADTLQAPLPHRRTPPLPDHRRSPSPAPPHLLRGNHGARRSFCILLGARRGHRGTRQWGRGMHTQAPRTRRYHCLPLRRANRTSASTGPPITCRRRRFPTGPLGSGARVHMRQPIYLLPCLRSPIRQIHTRKGLTRPHTSHRSRTQMYTGGGRGHMAPRQLWRSGHQLQLLQAPPAPRRRPSNLAQATHLKGTKPRTRPCTRRPMSRTCRHNSRSLRLPATPVHGRWPLPLAVPRNTVRRRLRPSTPITHRRTTRHTHRRRCPPCTA